MVTWPSSTSAVYSDTPGSNRGVSSPGLTTRALSATSQNGRSMSSRSWSRRSRQDAGMHPLSSLFSLR